MIPLIIRKFPKSTYVCLLFVCLFSAGCGNNNNAESTQPDPGLNPEQATAEPEKETK